MVKEPSAHTATTTLIVDGLELLEEDRAVADRLFDRRARCSRGDSGLPYCGRRKGNANWFPMGASVGTVHPAGYSREAIELRRAIAELVGRGRELVEMVLEFGEPCANRAGRPKRGEGTSLDRIGIVIVAAAAFLPALAVAGTLPLNGLYASPPLCAAKKVDPTGDWSTRPMVSRSWTATASKVWKRVLMFEAVISSGPNWWLITTRHTDERETFNLRVELNSSREIATITYPDGGMEVLQRCEP